MVSEAQIGELLVGAYHEIITDAEVVSYNQRSKEQGKQMEIDVVAIDSEDDRRTIYLCEVITHLDGINYSGSLDTERWAEFGNEGYQYTLEKLWNKFHANQDYATDVFSDSDEYVFQLWSPYVSKGKLTSGLDALSTKYEEETGHEIDILVNEEYTKSIDKLREKAGEDKKRYGTPAFRFLQILEHMRR